MVCIVAPLVGDRTGNREQDPAELLHVRDHTLSGERMTMYYEPSGYRVVYRFNIGIQYAPGSDQLRKGRYRQETE